jgi:hypothetical protein
MCVDENNGKNLNQDSNIVIVAAILGCKHECQPNI